MYEGISVEYHDNEHVSDEYMAIHFYHMLDAV